MKRNSGDVRLLQAVDHVRVTYRRWLPDVEVRGVLHIVHGASEHSGRYGRLACELAECGLAVYAMDLRGHGTTAETSGLGRFGGSGVDTVLHDVRGMHEVIHREHPDVPRILLGHSMGSGIALAAAQRDGDDLAGLVLSGPMGISPHLADAVSALTAAVEAGSGDLPADIFAPLNQPFEPARTPFDWLSRDASEVDAYITDPLTGDAVPLTRAYAAEVFGLAVQAATREGVSGLPEGLPVLLLAGEHDPVGGERGAHVSALAELLREHGLQVEERLYAEARHEVFNEANRDEVVHDLVTWLRKCVGVEAPAGPA
jgi:alpha-beta hydrolase superfamily lysophospholipase